jgi:hypothetical protein
VLLKLNLSSRRLLQVILISDTLCTVSLNLLVDVLEPLLNHIIIFVQLRLTLALVSAHIHCTTVSIGVILNFVYLSTWSRCFIILTMHRRLLHHNLVFVLLILVLEVTPFGQDFHCLNVLNSCQLLSIVLVTTECV